MNFEKCFFFNFLEEIRKIKDYFLLKQQKLAPC